MVSLQFIYLFMQQVINKGVEQIQCRSIKYSLLSSRTIRRSLMWDQSVYESNHTETFLTEHLNFSKIKIWQ